MLIDYVRKICNEIGIFHLTGTVDACQLKCRDCQGNIPIQFFRDLDLLLNSCEPAGSIEAMRDASWTANIAAYMRGQKMKRVNPVENEPEFLYVGVYHNIEGAYFMLSFMCVLNYFSFR